MLTFVNKLFYLPLQMVFFISLAFNFEQFFDQFLAFLVGNSSLFLFAIGTSVLKQIGFGVRFATLQLRKLFGCAFLFVYGLGALTVVIGRSRG